MQTNTYITWVYPKIKLTLFEGLIFAENKNTFYSNFTVESDKMSVFFVCEHSMYLNENK